MANNNNASWFEKWGAIIGIIGGIIGAFGGGMVIYDRLVSPDLEILGVAPIAVWEKIHTDPDQVVYGISLIARVQNTGSKPAYLLGADISGKVFLSYDEFWPICRMEKSNLPADEIELKFKTLKPYRRISWVGWIEDEKGLLRVDPDEERYVKITFSEPILSFGACWYAGEPSDEIGFENHETPPKIINHKTAIQWFMKNNALRDEFKKGLVKLEIKLGTKSKYINQNKISDLKIVTKAAWESYPARKVYFDLN